MISVHLSLPWFNLTQWKDKGASYSFTTQKVTQSMCQVSIVGYFKTKMEIHLNLETPFAAAFSVGRKYMFRNQMSPKLFLTI